MLVHYRMRLVSLSILLFNLYSCSTTSIEQEIIGEYKASPSDELSLGLETLGLGLATMGDFGKFSSTLTKVLANEVDVRFYFEEDKTGKFIMQNNGFFSKLADKVEKTEENFNYTIENDTALFFYENDISIKQRVGTIELNDYEEIDHIKIKLNKDDYGFLFMKLTKIHEE